MAGDGCNRVRDFIERALGSSESFLVDSESGSDAGVVDEVVLDESGRVAGIAVGLGWFGRKRWTFALDDVVAVMPASRRVVVSDSSVARARAPSQTPGSP